MESVDISPASPSVYPFTHESLQLEGRYKIVVRPEGFSDEFCWIQFYQDIPRLEALMDFLQLLTSKKLGQRLID